MNLISHLSRVRRSALRILTIAAVILFMTISTASATLLTINTNVLTAIDLGSQPLFLADPSDDL